MNSMNIVKDILQTFRGVVSLKTAINVANEIVEKHWEDGLEDYRTIEPFGAFQERVIEIKYYQHYFCSNCSGDDRWCHLCGGTGQTDLPEARYLQIWLNDNHELCWG